MGTEYFKTKLCQLLDLLCFIEHICMKNSRKKKMSDNYFNQHIDMKLKTIYYLQLSVVCCLNQGLLLQRELELGE